MKPKSECGICGKLCYPVKLTGLCIKCHREAKGRDGGVFGRPLGDSSYGWGF